MGTFLEIKVREYGPLSEDDIISAIDQAYNIGKELEQKFSLYNDSSELSRFNREKEGIYSVSEDFAELLSLSYDVYNISEGSFDPTVKPLVERWGFYGTGETEIPSDSEIREILKNVGLDKIQFDRNLRIVTKKAWVQLDFGGIGKGFAIDRMSRYLIKKGCRKFLVNLGGNVYASNLDEDGFLWRVGIKDPGGGGKPYKVIRVANKGISTSASYYNYISKDGQVLSHIIDPKSGYPVDHRIAVSIVTDSAALSDGLSTAAAVMGIEDSSVISGKLDDMDGVILMLEENGLKEYFLNKFESLTD